MSSPFGSCRFRHALLDHGEVELRVSDSVEVVGEDVQGNVADDRRDVRIVVPGSPNLGKVLVADVAALLVHGQREPERGRAPRIRRVAGAAEGELAFFDADEAADGGMRGEAVSATVRLCDGDRDLLVELPAECRLERGVELDPAL